MWMHQRNCENVSQSHSKSVFEKVTEPCHFVPVASVFCATRWQTQHAPRRLPSATTSLNSNMESYIIAHQNHLSFLHLHKHTHTCKSSVRTISVVLPSSASLPPVPSMFQLTIHVRPQLSPVFSPDTSGPLIINIDYPWVLRASRRG